MSELRALLLTDVVDSTQLSERLGDAAMAEVWVLHDRVARDLLPRWRGREIDKTDGMLLLFDAAADAVHYAHDYHQALAGLPVPLKARAGLHVGPVILRENLPEDIARGAKPLEVDGLAKPTAARVMSLASGGQTLLSAEALHLLGDTEFHHQSHGHWVMKGVSEPVELFEVGRDEKHDFRAPADGEKVYRVVKSGERWVPVKEIPNNLPQQSTSFVGREREIGELKSLLLKTRLITLLGMGGLGKTRLSLQVAAETMPRFPDGAWFVDLSAIRDPALVVAEAARVLDVAQEPGRSLVETLCAYLKPRRTLLVFDNCEHLTDPAGDLIDALLKAVPQIRILASSREALDVPGEQSFPIHPLPLPGRGDDVQALARSTAVRLFVARVQAHRPDFALEPAEAGDIADLVARLEGIPLAIELAAARMRTLGVAEISAGLAHRYQVLTGGSRRLQPRQQTMRALVDWSYEMLKPAEQWVLDRLAVFVGGFESEAAEAVCGAAPIDSADVQPALGSLVEKSLVMRELQQDGPRFRMLETIRDYAQEKLQERADDAAAAARHCEFFFGLSKVGIRGINGPEQARWLRRYEAERDNLRAARSLAVAGGVDPVIAAKLAVNMMNFWILRGYVSEGRDAVREVLALPQVQASDLAHAWVLYTGAALAQSQGEYAEAMRLLQACLVLRRGLGNPVQIAATLSTLALTRLQSGDPAGAAADEREALQLFRAEGDRVGEAIGLLHLGQVALYEGDDARAAAELTQAREVAQAIQHHEVHGESELLLGEVACLGGRLDDALDHCARSLAVCRDAADRRGEAQALRWLGKTKLARGELAAARQLLGEALTAFDAFEMREDIVCSLEDHAELALADDQPDLAARLAAAVAQLRSRLALTRPPRAESRWQAVLRGLREQLSDERHDAAWQQGRRWEAEDAVRAAKQTRASVAAATAAA
jgi:predicted ATPase/class 3 adenylate cyclase